MRRTRFDDWDCSIARTVDILGDWWTPMVICSAFLGCRRFEQFTEQLGRHLMRGRSLVRDVVEELHPDPMRMEDAAVVAKAQERAS